MNRVRDADKPSGEVWSDADWASVRASAPLVLLPYSPGVLVSGGRGNIVVRASEIVPFVSGRNLRLCADSSNLGVARAWLGQMLSMPNGAHDDAVQATIGGVLAFDEILNDREEEPIDEALILSRIRKSVK
jgi:hypothetical protein